MNEIVTLTVIGIAGLAGAALYAFRRSGVPAEKEDACALDDDGGASVAITAAVMAASTSIDCSSSVDCSSSSSSGI